MIICNATPLIAFARIQKLELLHQVVGAIVIPEEVANEIIYPVNWGGDGINEKMGFKCLE